jgi:hypothetical protein
MGPPAAARLHSAIGYITPGAIFRESESLADPITLQRSMILFPSPIIEANARFKYSNRSPSRCFVPRGSLVERKAMLERLLRRAPSEFGSDAAA